MRSVATLWIAATLFAPCLHPQDRAPSVLLYIGAADETGPLGARDIWSIREDGSGAKRLTQDGGNHGASWSPDGRRILFIHEVERRPLELHVMDADGSNRRLLRRFDSVIYSPAWSPDGKTIAVSWRSESSPNREVTPQGRIQPGLFLLPADGKGELRHVAASALSPSWSPDGKKLAFSVDRPAGAWSIHVANSDGSGNIRLIGPENRPGLPAWSPDGRRIAFSQDVSGKSQIFVMDADGSNVKQLTREPNWSVSHPSWSSDGRRIAFGGRSAAAPCGGLSSTGHLMPNCTSRIFVVNVGDSQGRVRQVSDRGGVYPEFRPSSGK